MEKMDELLNEMDHEMSLSFEKIITKRQTTSILSILGYNFFCLFFIILF